MENCCCSSNQSNQFPWLKVHIRHLQNTLRCYVMLTGILLSVCLRVAQLLLMPPSSVYCKKNNLSAGRGQIISVSGGLLCPSASARQRTRKAGSGPVLSRLERRDQSGELIDPLPGHYTPEWSYRREKQRHPT